MNIKLTKEQIELLNTGNIINTVNKKYYYLPFWFEEDKDNNFKILNFDSLPNELIEIIKEKKDI